MKSEGYWLSPEGRLLDVTHSSHIRAIIDAPAAFFLTASAVREAYTAHSEPLGQEGAARTLLIRQALGQGFIRLRHYPNGGPVNGWSATCHTLNDATRSLLARWASDESQDIAHPEDIAVLVSEVDREQRTTVTLAALIPEGGQTAPIVRVNSAADLAC